MDGTRRLGRDRHSDRFRPNQGNGPGQQSLSIVASGDADLPIRALPVVGAPLPLFDAAGTRDLERLGAERLAPHLLMRRAGASVARLAMALAPHARRIWIAAGPGNNGGDALEAAARLTEAGRRVEVGLIGDAAALPPGAAEALLAARDTGAEIGTGLGPESPVDFAIDGLLGIGASRPPTGSIAAAIQALHRLAVPVLAIDLPSGLDARTGRPLGEVCVRADHTLALLSLKPGLVTGLGRDMAGTIWLDELGMARDPGFGAPTAWLSGVDPGRRRSAGMAQNKGSFGDVAILGGAPGMAGAALLAARAAQAAGAGRVYLELLDRSPAIARLDPIRPELMFRDGWLEAAGDALARATVVCGCGGGKAVEAPLPTLLAGARRLVLDADALNAIAADPALAAELAARAGRRQSSVITPHPLEAARLLGTTVDRVEADRLAAAAELAERFGCTAVLKGSGSIVAAPGRVPHINATGSAALASAGTGDVLAGWLGGRWAQHREPEIGADGLAFEIAWQAVAEHGAAADHPPVLGALRAADLIERLQADPEGRRGIASAAI